MLSWLYLGKSFERMVERGEEIRKQADAGYLSKVLIVSTNKILKSKSVSLGLQPKEAGIEYQNMMQVVGKEDVFSNCAIQRYRSRIKQQDRTSDFTGNLLFRFKKRISNKSLAYFILVIGVYNSCKRILWIACLILSAINSRLKWYLCELKQNSSPNGNRK